MIVRCYYRKNLKMSEGKLAAQVAHAVAGLFLKGRPDKIIVLEASDKKFDELFQEHKTKNICLQIDKGFTEIDPKTPTAFAYVDENRQALNADIACEIAAENSKKQALELQELVNGRSENVCRYIDDYIRKSTDNKILVDAIGTEYILYLVERSFRDFQYYVDIYANKGFRIQIKDGPEITKKNFIGWTIKRKTKNLHISWHCD